MPKLEYEVADEKVCQGLLFHLKLLSLPDSELLAVCLSPDTSTLGSSMCLFLGSAQLQDIWSLMALGPSLQHTPESLLWAGASHSCFCLPISSGCWAEPLHPVNIFCSCYLGFKFKCQKSTVCGTVFLCYSLILGFAKFAAFPNIPARKHLC